MADRKGRSGRGTIITIIVIAAVVIVGWWLFAQWNQPPATMRATGEPPVQTPSEGAPMMKGSPEQGTMQDLDKGLQQD